MKPRTRILLSAFGLFGLWCCTSQREAHREERIAITAKHDETGSATASERTTRVAGPVDVVTVTEVFGPAQKEAGPPREEPALVAGAAVTPPVSSGEPPVEAGHSAPARNVSMGGSVPEHGPLIKRITRTEHRGPVEAVKDRELRTETASRDTLAVDAGVTLTETEKSAPSPSCAFGGWLWAAAVIAVAVAALRLRK